LSLLLRRLWWRWFLVLYNIYVHFILHQNITRKYISIVTIGVILLLYYICNRVFIDNYRYLEIYRQSDDLFFQKPVSSGLAQVLRPALGQEATLRTSINVTHEYLCFIRNDPEVFLVAGGMGCSRTIEIS
jgi:hypothetical protein